MHKQNLILEINKLKAQKTAGWCILQYSENFQITNNKRSCVSMMNAFFFSYLLSSFYCLKFSLILLCTKKMISNIALQCKIKTCSVNKDASGHRNDQVINDKNLKFYWLFPKKILKNKNVRKWMFLWTKTLFAGHIFLFSFFCWVISMLITLYCSSELLQDKGEFNKYVNFLCEFPKIQKKRSIWQTK